MGDIIVSADGELRCGGKRYRCALGMGGVRADKREGDGATPIGCFPIRNVYYRNDRLGGPPRTAFPTIPLSEDDGWSDDTNRPEYNRHVKLPYRGSHERLWRDDGLYDIVVVLGYNDDPPAVGMGSAIFLHVARDGYAPTAGCVALSKGDLLEVLGSADASTQVCVR